MQTSITCNHCQQNKAKKRFKAGIINGRFKFSCSECFEKDTQKKRFYRY